MAALVVLGTVAMGATWWLKQPKPAQAVQAASPGATVVAVATTVQAVPEAKAAPADPSFAELNDRAATPATTRAPAARDGGAATTEAKGKSRDDDRRAEQERRLREAMARVPITIYVASWCPVCQRAVAWMQSSGLRYDARDVDNDSSAKAAARRINPRGSIPVFEIDGRTLIGFSPGSVTALLRQAAEAQLSRE